MCREGKRDRESVCVERERERERENRDRESVCGEKERDGTEPTTICLRLLC